MNLNQVINPIQMKLEWMAKKLLQPKILTSITTKFPLILNSTVIEKIFNQCFTQQIKEGDFDFLNQKTLGVNLTDAELIIGLTFKNNKINCFNFGSNAIETDVTLSINTFDAISLIQQEIDPDTLFFQRKLKIQGNTELAHHLKNTIDTLDPEVIPQFIQKLINQYKKRVLN